MKTNSSGKRATRTRRTRSSTTDSAVIPVQMESSPAARKMASEISGIDSSASNLAVIPVKVQNKMNSATTKRGSRRRTGVTTGAAVIPIVVASGTNSARKPQRKRSITQHRSNLAVMPKSRKRIVRGKHAKSKPRSGVVSRPHIEIGTPVIQRPNLFVRSVNTVIGAEETAFELAARYTYAAIDVEERAFRLLTGRRVDKPFDLRQLEHSISAPLPPPSVIESRAMWATELEAA